MKLRKFQFSRHISCKLSHFLLNARVNKAMKIRSTGLAIENKLSR